MSLGDFLLSLLPCTASKESTSEILGYRWHDGLPVPVTNSPTNLGRHCGLPGYTGLVQRETVSSADGPIELITWPQFRIGGSLWPSGVLLCQAFVQHKHSPVFKGLGPLDGLRVVELGAGVGVAGVGAAYAGAEQVWVTDILDLVPLMEENCVLHNGIIGRQVLQAATLDWCFPETSELAARDFDLLVAGDVVYAEEMAPLWSCIDFLLPVGSKRKLLLTYRERTEADRRYLEDEMLPKFSLVEKSAYTCDGVSCELYVLGR